jgi:hypothetical protein
MDRHCTAKESSVLSIFILIVVAGWLNYASAADLQLSWTDNSNNESGFAIERKTGTSGTFSQRATVGANVTNYVDANLAAATTFCYRVRAFNSAGNSAFTPEACKTTPSSPPPPLFDFSVAHSGNKSVTRGQSVGNQITATLVSGSSQSVSFSTSALPSGVTASFSSSNACTPTCSRTLNLATSSSAATGTHSITITAVGGGVTKTTTFNLTVNSSTSPAFDFALTHGGNKSVPRGQSVSNVITATLVSGSAQSVSFSTSGLPSGASASYSSSSSCTPTCSRTLNIATSSSTAAGTYPITVGATGAGITKNATFNLTVTSASPPANDLITLEAESGRLTAPMIVASDSSALNGKFVQVPEGAGNNTNDSSNGGPGQVQFTINIPQSGTHVLWARTIAPNSASDSFYVTRNGALLKKWSAPVSTTWKWSKIAKFSLSAGTVNLAFRQREDGAKLDQIILTTNLDFTPGQSSSTMLAAVAAAPTEGQVLTINVVNSLTSSGSGNGTVTSSPTGINCGSDCTQSFSAGTAVKLVARPASGSTFTGWSGDADCNDGAVTMNTSLSCTATFAAQALGLHVSKSGAGAGNIVSEPAGISCGSDCSEPFPNGAAVTLTATAAGGSSFKGWSGGCSGTTKCTVVVSGSTSVSALFESSEPDQGIAKIGIYRPSTGDIFLDRNGNGEWEDCSTDVCAKWLAQAGGIPIAGDWDGNGTARIGTFDSASGAWYLDRNGNGRWDGCTVDICIKTFGMAGDIPVLSSNGTNRPLLGLYRATGGVWQVDTNGNNRFDECEVDTCYSKFGDQDMYGLAGDWDGSGKSRIATFAPKSGSWLIDANGDGKRDGCTVDACYSSFGQVDDIPVAGDWDGSGKTKIGVFRPQTGEWFLDKNGNGQLDSCGVDTCIKAFGQPGDKPLVGKWLGVGSP